MIGTSRVAHRRNRFLGAAAGLATLAAMTLPANTIQAQDSRFSLWLGTGGALPLSQPAIGRTVGPGVLAAVEVAASRQLSVRAEWNGNVQKLDTRSEGPLSGDVQQGRASLAARFTPVRLRRVAPYVLAGAGWFWQSDRLVVSDLANPVPDAAYRQTSSHNQLGGILGAGGAADAGRLRVFGEARWTRSGSSDPTTDISILAGLTIPLGR